MIKATAQDVAESESFCDDVWSHLNEKQRKEPQYENARKLMEIAYIAGMVVERKRAEKMAEALKGVIAVADRETKEFDAAKEALSEYRESQ